MKDYLVVFLIMEGLLVDMFNIWGYQICLCQQDIIKIIFFVLSFPIFFRTCAVRQNGGMHSKTPCFRLLRMNRLLHCMHLPSRLHMLQTDETPWKQRHQFMAFPFSQKFFGALTKLAFILKNLSCDKILCLHLYSAHWEGSLLSQWLFSLLAVPKFVWTEKPFVNLLLPLFSESKSGPLYYPSKYAVTVFPVHSKWFSELDLMQEIPVCLCASFSSAESMSLQFFLIPRFSLPPLQPVSEISVCKRAWGKSWIKVFPSYISIVFTHQRSFNWDYLFSNTWLL